MILPEDIKLKFHEEIIKYEEKSNIPFITTAESIGIEKGIKKGTLDTVGDDVIEAQEIRFGFVHANTIKTIKKIKNIEKPS